ncbi:MAG: hypothetical protein E7265_10720 [Lachnospiraceae bacterium]|nr:hypothetical protein [Lachnospiraceae bacterium]
MSQISYQYLNNINIYSFKELAVTNAAYYEQKLTYNASNTSIPDFDADILVYSKDSASSIMSRLSYDGVDVSGESHFFAPEELPEKSKHLGTFSGGKNNTSYDDAVYDANYYLSRYRDDVIKEYTKWLNENTWSRNDRFEISCDGITYSIMSDEKVYGCIINEVGKTAAISDYAYGAGGTTIANIKPEEVKASQTSLIPYNTDNGRYKTRTDIVYKKEVGMSSAFDFAHTAGQWAVASADSIYDHVMPGSVGSGGGCGEMHTGSDGPTGEGYAISVHTPILTLISILDENFEATTTPDSQLVDASRSAQYYLRLDEEYYMRWEQDAWLSAMYGYDTPEGYESLNYDKFVESKAFRCGFDVYYEGKFYPVQRDGYTDWIDIKTPSSYDAPWETDTGVGSNNHWAMTPFYIPSFADETPTGYSFSIQTKVVAINDGGRYDNRQHSPQLAVEMNSEETQYRAGYSTKVQTYGWLYGFTAVGTDNAFPYANESTLTAHTRIYEAFARNKKEAVAGIYNRVGVQAQRYLTDGSLTTSAINTLPLRRGSNSWHLGHKDIYSGEVIMGEQFSFLVKSMGGATGANDYIEIKPTFKFIATDGRVYDHDEIVVLFADNDMSGAKIYGEETPALISRDNSMWGLNNESFMNTFYCDADKFDSIFYAPTLYPEVEGHFGNWFQYSHERDLARYGYNSAKQRSYIYYRTTKNYGNLVSQHLITIKDNMRLLSGEWEQLSVNSLKQGNEVVTYLDYDSDGRTDAGLPTNYETLFRDSFQTWYGMFPTKTYYKVFLKSDYQKQINEVNPAFRDAGSAWLRCPLAQEAGKLVIGFEITLYRDGVAHLTYAGMWNTEGYQKITTKEYFTEDIGKDAEKMPADGIIYDEVMVEEGDVIVVDMQNSVGDRYDTGLWALN